MVGIYIRVSTLQQKDNYSVDTQRERGIAFANRLGESYILYDEAASAKNVEGRVEFVRLLADVEKKLIDKVWVIEFSRLTRDIEDALTIRKAFLVSKADIYVNDAVMDLSSPEAVLMYHIKSSVSEYERSNTIARVVRARRKQIDDGEQSFSDILGYNYKFREDGKKIWYVEEKEAEIVRHIFSLYGKGLSYETITRALNDSGYQTKKGKKFTITTIAKILAHPEYFGQTKNTKGELVESKIYPAILDKEQFKSLQTQHLNRQVKALKFRSAKCALSGLIVCKECGARYYAHRSPQYVNKKKVGFLNRYLHQLNTTAQQACNNRPKYIPKDSIDELVDICYKSTIRQKVEIKRLLKEKEKQVFLAEDTLTKQIAMTESKLIEIEENRKKLISGIAAGLYTVDDIRDNMVELNKKKLDIENVIKTLQSQMSVQHGEIEDVIKMFADRTIEEYESATPEKKRQIYNSMIKEIQIDNQEISIIMITGRKYKTHLKFIPEYINALKNMGNIPVFANERYRWEDIT